ncbi:MAG: hypothetical protein IPM42_20640 [Saprospiraceae bacterium]|nr:hypothetical protein [Saprospiraceae bacterium]
MLFKVKHIEGIKSGEVTLAFRSWQKAAINEGTLLHTSIGLVEIGKIQIIDQEKITHEDVIKAGFSKKELLLKTLRQTEDANIYKIEVRFHSEDPRIALRQQNLTDDIYQSLKQKLARLDKSSKQGEWTMKVLTTISQNPHLHAVGIAELTGFTKEWLKLNIRKFKNLGLTISHTVGYELSPLGKAFCRKME